MAVTIQTIETPKKARGLDTSTGEQIVGNQLLEDPSFDTDVAAGGTGTGTWRCEDSHLEITGGKAVWTAYTGSEDRRLVDNVTGPFDDVTARYRATVTVSDYTDGALKLVTGSYNSGFVINSTGTFTFDFSPETGAGNYHLVASKATDSAGDAVLSVSEVSLYKLESFPNNNHAQIYSGRGLEFDGVTDYLVASTATDTQFPTMHIDKTTTVACWIKVNTMEDRTIWFSSLDSQNSRLGMNIGADGEIGTVTWNGSVYTAASGGTAGTKIINTDTWYRIVSTCNNNSLQLYINGVLQTGTALPFSSPLASTNGGNFRIGYRNSEYFDGCISDFQVWDKVWTQDEVTYDYVNPEQLALNKGGTSLTNSNLKLWYPMNEGHRGNQTSVLDASNVGLSDNLIANPDFETDSTGGNHIATDENSNNALNDWFIPTAGDYSSNFSIDTFFSSTEFGGNKICKIINTNAGGFVGIASNAISIQSGKTYKVSYTYRASGSGTKGKVGHLKNSTGGSHVGGSTQQQLDETSITEHSYFFTATETETNYVTFIVPNGVTFEVDNVSIQVVNDKHSATTEFLGDDLFDSGVGDYGDSTGAWVAEGNNTIANDTSALKITYVDDDDGAKLFLKDDADLTSDLTIGRKYRLTFTYKINQVSGENIALQINTGDSTNFATTGTLTQSSFTTTTKDFVANHATNANIRFNNMTSGDIIHIKDLKLQEIGIAQGWTDADNQPDIAQTALQSFNAFAYTSGDDDSTSGTINFGAITSASWTTVDMWFYPIPSSQGQSQGLFDQISWNGDDADSATGGYGFRATINTSDNVQLT